MVWNDSWSLIGGSGRQPGGLVEDVDLGPGRPVDLVAGEQAPAETLVSRGRCRARSGSSLPVLTSKRSTRSPVAIRRPLATPSRWASLTSSGSRLGLPDEPAAGGVEGVDRRRVIGGDDHQAVVDDRRVQVAVAALRPFDPVLPG